MTNETICLRCFVGRCSECQGPPCDCDHQSSAEQTADVDQVIPRFARFARFTRHEATETLAGKVRGIILDQIAVRVGQVPDVHPRLLEGIEAAARHIASEAESKWSSGTAHTTPASSEQDRIAAATAEALTAAANHVAHGGAIADLHGVAHALRSGMVLEAGPLRITTDHSDPEKITYRIEQTQRLRPRPASGEEPSDD